MTWRRDARGDEPAALTAAAEFSGKRILEVGCGEGRLTWVLARSGASVLGIDPNEESIETARATTPAELAERVEFRVASAEQLDVPPARFDIAFLSWSL